MASISPIARKLALATCLVLTVNLLPHQVEGAARCSVQGFSGACLTASTCRASDGTGASSDSCQEAGSVCCYKPSCATGGSCKWKDQCVGTGKPKPNLCPGPSDFQCCVTTSAPSTPAPTFPPCGARPCGESSSGPFMYVALGDSYAAGLGSSDDYDPSSGTCKRSPNAYPVLLANMLGAHLDFKACSGAVIADVRMQLSSLSEATNLVTLSVGGNDLGFTTVLTGCASDVLHNCNLTEKSTYASTELKAKLAAFYTEVKTKAKNARVVVTGYPRLFADQLVDQYWNCLRRWSAWVTIAEMTLLNELADTLAEAMKSAAESTGVEYVDMRKTFDDHAICDGDAWLNGLSAEKKPEGGIRASDETAHPNKKGQDVFARAVMCQIRGQHCN